MCARASAERTFDDSPASGRGSTRAQAALILVLECDRPMAGSVRLSLDGLDQILIGRGPTRTFKREQVRGTRTLTIRVPGRSMSANHARLCARSDHWVFEDDGST